MRHLRKLGAALACAAALIAIAPVAAQPQTPPVAPAPPATADALWSAWGAQHRIRIQGWIDQGEDTARSDSEVRVNVIMRNGLVVPLTSGYSPGRRPVLGSSAYVTDFDVAAVEVIFSRGLLPVERGVRKRTVRTENLGPDSWDFNAIQLAATLYRRDRPGGPWREVARRDVFAASPMRRMTYGVWASAELPRVLEPPPQVRDADGHLAFHILTGADDIKSEPAEVAALVDTGGGPLRDGRLRRFVNIGRLGDTLPAFRAGDYWNAEGVEKFRAETETQLGYATRFRWNDTGRVGLRYRYGDHGLERDDWDVKAVIVDFCPVFLTADRVCFRKASHYMHSGAPDTRLVQLNGDGAGTDAWAPFRREGE